MPCELKTAAPKCFFFTKELEIVSSHVWWVLVCLFVKNVDHYSQSLKPIHFKMNFSITYRADKIS